MQLHFDGKTYDPALDHNRLTKQLGRVFELMSDGKWRTLAQIALMTGSPEASVSARLRDLRKEKFGGYSVKRRRVGEAPQGLFSYKLTRFIPTAD